MSVLLDDHAKSSAIVPHRPAYAVSFQGRTNSGNPRGASGWGRRFAVNPKLVARERQVPPLAPCRALADFLINPRRIPALHSVMNHGQAIHRVSNLRSGLLRV